jgi:hypothetical protein
VNVQEYTAAVPSEPVSASRNTDDTVILSKDGQGRLRPFSNQSRSRMKEGSTNVHGESGETTVHTVR